MLPISSSEAKKKAIGTSMVNGSRDRVTKKDCSNNFLPTLILTHFESPVPGTFNGVEAVFPVL